MKKVNRDTSLKDALCAFDCNAIFQTHINEKEDAMHFDTTCSVVASLLKDQSRISRRTSSFNDKSAFNVLQMQLELGLGLDQRALFLLLSLERVRGI